MGSLQPSRAADFSYFQGPEPARATGRCRLQGKEVNILVNAISPLDSSFHFSPKPSIPSVHVFGKAA